MNKQGTTFITKVLAFLENPKRYGFLLWYVIGCIFVLLTKPFEEAIWHDRAYFLYMAQEVARGNPIYITTTLGYTPLTQLISGGFIALGNFIHTAEYSTILYARILSVLGYGVLIGSAYRFAQAFFKDYLLQILLPLSFLCVNFLYAFSSVSLEPKVLVMIFTLWGYYCASKDRFFYAGLCFSLASMCWHLAVVNCFVYALYLLIITPLKSYLRVFGLLGLGVFVGTIPVLIYLGVYDQWIPFWKQAILRKVAIEGGELFESPLHWMQVCFRGLRFERIFLILGATGFFSYGKSFFEKRNASLHLNLLGCATVVWSVINSVEFQSIPDLLPILPLILFWCVYIISIIHHRWPFIGYIVPLVFVVYALIGLHLDRRSFSFNEQQKWIQMLGKREESIWVVNFEEYYVIKERQMPSKYMRMGAYEDYIIAQTEINGCEALVGKVIEMQPLKIIERVNDRVGSIGVKGVCEKTIEKEVLPDTPIYDSWFINTFHQRPFSPSRKAVEYRSYPTKYAQSIKE